MKQRQKYVNSLWTKMKQILLLLIFQIVSKKWDKLDIKPIENKKWYFRCRKWEIRILFHVKNWKVYIDKVLPRWDVYNPT